MNLATLFERERNRLWTKLSAVAARHETLDALLSREGDSRVGYLVDSAAYGLARLRERFSDDAPEETHAIVATSMPEVVRPYPAMTVAQWSPGDMGVAGGGEASSHLELPSTPVDGVPCSFQTLWPVVATGLSLSRVRFEVRETGRAVLRLRFALPEGLPVREAFPERLRLFVKAADPFLALDVVHAASTNVGVSVSTLDERGVTVATRERTGVRLVSTLLEEPGQFLPGQRDAFLSQSLLRTYFAFPEALAFMDVEGVAEILAESPHVGGFAELTISLAKPLSDAAKDVSLHLHCVPCANVRQATFAPLTFMHALTPQRITADGLPDSELYEVTSLRIGSQLAGSSTESLRLWHYDDGRVLRPGSAVGRLLRRAGPRGGQTHCDLELVVLGGGDLARTCTVTMEGMVTDGARAGRLLPGDVGVPARDSAWVNITRVTSPLPVSMNRNVPWRANAYARITAKDFATPRAMRGFLEVFDVTERRARLAGSVQQLGIERVVRRGFERVVGDQVHGGDRVDMTLQADGFGGHGAAWFLGELLARAHAERTDALRFSHLRWVERDGTVVADYGIRPGERLPFPFG